MCGIFNTVSNNFANNRRHICTCSGCSSVKIDVLQMLDLTPKSYITTFVFKVCHLTGNILIFKKIIPHEKQQFLSNNDFPNRQIKYNNRIFLKFHRNLISYRVNLFN